MKKLITICKINIVLFIFFGVINYFQPLIVDDLARGAIAAFYNHALIKSVIGDYYGWTGRISAQFLAYLFFNKPYEIYLNCLFNVINSILMVYFLNIIFKIAIKNEERKKTAHFFLSFVLFFLLILIFTGFFKNLIWKTVGLQYFWGICLIFYLYSIIIFAPKSKIDNIYLMFILGLLIGLYNEIYFALVLIFLVGYILDFIFISRLEYNKSLISLLMGDLIGGLILISAPGNYIRQKIINSNSNITLNDKFHILLNSYFEHKLFLILFLVAVICVFIDKSKTPYLKLMNICYLICMLFITLPVGNVGFSDRMLMLQTVICSIIIFQFLYKTDFFCNIISKIYIEVFVVLLGIVFSINLLAYFSMFQFNALRYQQINLYHKLNIKNAYFGGFKSKFIKFVYFDDIESESSNWKNNAFSQYYDFEKVELKK